MSKSTNINSLPNINELDTNVNDDDATIHEVLAEIQDENEAQLNGNPKPPMETMQQMPPQPTMQPAQVPQQSLNNFNIQQQQQETIKNQIEQLNLLNSLNGSNNKSKLNIILDELNNNFKLFLAIFISFIVLQNTSLQQFIFSKINKFDNYYIKLSVLAILQVLFVLLSKLLV